MLTYIFSSQSGDIFYCGVKKKKLIDGTRFSSIINLNNIITLKT